MGDDREKYPEQVRLTAIILYLEGCGFRRIARILREIFRIKVHYQLVIHWIKQAGVKLEKREEKRQALTIPVLELDELYTYVQKKQIKSEYGLLLLETGCVLVHLKSGTEARKL
jgi:transposase-like protein